MAETDFGGEQWVGEAHGLTVTWDRESRFTVWNLHPSGRWVHNRIVRYPDVAAEAVEAVADRLLAECLSERHNKHVSRWTSDEKIGWGPMAAEQAVQAGWDAEAAARGQVRLPSQAQMVAVRDADYGAPGPNWATTAALWREYLFAKHGVDVEVDTDDVGMLNVLQKVARHARRPKPDNLDDIAGYVDAITLARLGNA